MKGKKGEIGKRTRERKKRGKRERKENEKEEEGRERVKEGERKGFNEKRQRNGQSLWSRYWRIKTNACGYICTPAQSKVQILH